MQIIIEDRMKVFNTGLKVARGDVHIQKDMCKGCGFCVNYCPMNVLELSDEFNAQGYHFPKAVKPEECINCHLCEMLCPDFAIWVTLKQEKEVAEVAAGCL